MLNLFHVLLPYFVAVYFMMYFDICLAYNRVTQSCVDYMWDRNNKMCQWLHGGKGSFLSSQDAQSLPVDASEWLQHSNTVFIQVSDSRCSACVCSCMQAKPNVCVYAIWWGAQVRSFSSVKAAALFIRDSSSFTRGKLFANVSNSAEKPLTSKIEIYTVLHNKE